MATIEYRKLRFESRAGIALGDVLAVATVFAVSVALMAFFLVQEKRLVGELGMPLDDAWIHFRIAQNLADGYGFSFNPGELSSASTSPAWTALLAVAYLATGQFVVPALALGGFFYLATNLAVYYLALQVKADRRLGLAAAVLCAVTGRWVWASLSGMETTLFTALALWGLLLYSLHERGHRVAFGAGAALLALSALVRPSGFLLLGLVIGCAALPSLSTGALSVRDLLRRLLGGNVPILVVLLFTSLAIRVGYTLITGGGLAGNTFLAQSLPQGDGPYTGPRLLPDIWYIRSAVRSLTTDNFLLGLLIPLGMLHWIRLAISDRRARSVVVLGLLWFAALPLLNSVVAPNLRHHERYLMPLIPLAVLFGAFGVDFLVRQTVGQLPRLKMPVVGVGITSVHVFTLITLVCLGDALFESRRWSIQYAGDARSIQVINVGLGQWLRDNTPSDAYVAMNDIGAIAFISGRRVLDTVGIAEPGILPQLSERGRAGVFEYLRLKRPDYLVIWPEWYPEMAAMEDVFRPIHSIKMDDPVVATRDSMLGGREMVVYEAHWP